MEPDPEQACPGYVGGFNQFRHHSRSATPYSWGWLDLQATGRGAGTDLFAGPRWQGSVPKQMAPALPR